MSTPYPLTARPKIVNLTARNKGATSTSTGKYSDVEWVDEAGNNITDEEGNNLIFKQYDGDTKPIELTARPKIVNLTAREKDG